MHIFGMKLHMCGYPNPVPIQMITTYYTHLTIQCPNHSNLEPKMLHFFYKAPSTLRGRRVPAMFVHGKFHIN